MLARYKEMMSMNGSRHGHAMTTPAPSRYHVVPVTPATLPDEGLRGIWERILTEGKVSDLFYSGGIETCDDFVQAIRSPWVAPVAVVDTTNAMPVLLAWLTNLGSGSAFVHYCTLGHPRRDAGRALLAYWEHLVDEAGDPLIEVLLGITPETHVAALRVIRIMGFTNGCTIPRYCQVAVPPGRVGGVLSYRQLRAATARSKAGRPEGDIRPSVP